MPIGTTAAILGGAAIAGGASLIGSSKAAKSQAAAADEAGDTQRAMFERSVELSEPWRTAGMGALSALEYELGLGSLPTLGATTTFNVGDQSFSTREAAEQYRQSLISSTGSSPPVTQGRGESPDGSIYAQPQTGVLGAPGANIPGITETTTGGQPYAGFRETPGYQFQLDEGQKAINRSLAARGKLLSGPAVKEGMRFSQGLADQTYANHLSRLANMAGLGANVAGQQGQFGITTGAGLANSAIQGGNARASGYAATGQAIGGGINTLAGLYGAFGGGGGWSLAGHGGGMIGPGTGGLY